jgi:hypothetical protein
MELTNEEQEFLDFIYKENFQKDFDTWIEHMSEDFPPHQEHYPV